MSSPRRWGVLTQQLRVAVPNADMLSLASPLSPTGGTTSTLLQQYDQQQEKGEAALNLWLYCCIHIYIIGCGCTVAVNYLNPVPQTVVCDLRSVVMKIRGYTL
jgi:hypothetical protein